VPNAPPTQREQRLQKVDGRARSAAVRCAERVVLVHVADAAEGLMSPSGRPRRVTVPPWPAQRQQDLDERRLAGVGPTRPKTSPGFTSKLRRAANLLPNRPVG
jgi:hypothetical protein